MNVTSICCIGAGYVGGPTMAVIALKCPNIKITVVDINQARIDAWNHTDLEKLPIYETGLKEVVAEARGRNLFFSTDIKKAIYEAQMIFMSVNTPTKTYGKGKGLAADLTFVEKSARQIAKVAKTNKIIVEKSTLPVKTAEKIKEVLLANNTNVSFEILSNPEFLAEGTAVQDLLNPDRILVGGESTKSGKMAVETLVSIYKNWIPEEKILTTNVWSSELSKLASNAMLAQRVSSINSLSALCEVTGASIDEVSKAIGMDSRIGSKFLKSSVGFGGSCFQKDILNLVYLCKNYGLEEVAEYWHQVIKINDYQKNRFALKIINGLNGTVNQKKITLLGWAFKKDTNDTRESAAIYVADVLLDEGAEVHVYDPMVDQAKIHHDLSLLWESKNDSTEEIQSKLERCVVHENHMEATHGSFAVAILTEWDEFIEYPWDLIVSNMMRPTKVYDGRNIITNNQHLTNIVESIGN